MLHKYVDCVSELGLFVAVGLSFDVNVWGTASLILVSLEAE